MFFTIFFTICMKSSDERQEIKWIKYSVYFLHIYLIHLDPKHLEERAGSTCLLFSDSFNTMVCPRKGNQHCIEVVHKYPILCCCCTSTVLRPAQSSAFPLTSPTIHIVFNGIKCSIHHIPSASAYSFSDMGPTESRYIGRPLTVYMCRSWCTQWWCDSAH